MISNQQLQEVRKNNIANVGNVLDQLGLGDSEMGQYIKTAAENAPKMNQEQYDQYMAALQDWSNTTTQLAAKEEELQGTLDVLNMVYGTKLKTPSAVNEDDETGKISFTEAEEARANLSNKQLTALASKEDFVEETQQIMSLSKELGKAQTAYENFKSGLLDADKALEMLDESTNQAINSLIDLNEAGILNDRTFEDIKETFLQVYEGWTKGTDDAEGLEQELDELIRRFSNLGEAASSMDPNTFKRWILSGIEQAKKQEQELQGLRTQDEQNKSTATGQIENIVSQNAIEGVIKVTSSLGELAGAIITVQNLGQILTNDDLGPMEKFVQILTGIGILIPTVLTSIKSMLDGIKALKEAQIIENTALAAHQILEVTGLKIKQQNIIKNIENATSMKAEMVAAAELAGTNTALATAETAAGAAATKLAGGLASVWAALGPIGIAIIGLTAILGGSALKYLWDEAKEAEAQQKVLNELTDQTAETANKLNETAPALNELYDAYKQTGEASDEFKQSLESQAELLGINDAALLISQGKYEDLKAKIDEATEAIYNNNAALQQAKLDKINPNEMVNELTNDQKERYNVTYHQEEGITGVAGGTATKGQVNKLDQTPYELVKVAQQDIETQQEKINSLTQKRNDLVKEGLTATGEASRKIAEDIAKIDNEITEVSKKLAESKEFTEKYSDVLEGSDVIRDNALNQELSNPNSIFKTGNYEDINKFISAQQGVDSSNIDILIKKYSELTGNIDAAAEATLRLQDQQIQNNQGIWKEDTISPFGDTQMRFHHYGEEGRDKLNSFAINNELSMQDKAKISDMIDWSDPDVDQKVAELLQRIQEGLDEGLSLTDALKIPENPEDVMASFSEMKPIDTDVAEESFQNLGKYINENWEELEQLNEALGESAQFLETDADYLAEVTEAILRYQDAIDESTEKMDDWLEALDSNNFEKRSNAIAEMTDNMEDLLGLDAGTLSSDFVTAEDNIENFKDAINGVEEAYDQLYHDAIAEEVLHIEADDTQAMAVFDECWAALNEFDGYANKEIELTANDAQAIAAMENLLNSLGLVGDAAIETAKAMGYEIELEPGEVEANDTQEVVGFLPREVTTPWSASIMPSANPNAGPGALAAALNPVTASGVYSGVAYDQENYSDVATKKTSAAGMKVKTGTGESSGGGVTIKSLKRIAPTGGAKNSMSGSKGGGGGSCFIAGTKISTYFGLKNIEDIQKNDIVLSYNEKLGINEYSKVLQTMIHNTIEPIYTLYIKDEQLRVTGIHRFLISRDIFHSTLQWVPAADLQIGDWMFLADGTWHLIHNIEVNVEHQIVYNFEVAGNHNYYVGRNQILAHNKGGSCFVAGTLVSTSLGFKPIEQIQKKDIVLSYNKSIGSNEYSKVLQTMIHDTTEPIYTLYIKDEQLRVTGIHRFFVTDKITCGIPQWVHAADLKIGQWVLFADGTWHVIHKIEVNIEHQTVYNFEVSHNHNYYVGHNQILAHNKGGKGGKGGSGSAAKPKTAEKKEAEKYQKKYYEEVDHQLDKVGKTLDKVEKTTDKLIGTQARTKQNEQIKLLQKELTLQQKKLKILQEQEKVDVAKNIQETDKKLEELLKKQGLDINILDITFDEEGFVKNYDEVGQAITDAQNKLIDKRNALINPDGTISDENEELLKEIDKEISKYDKLGKELMKDIDRYDDIVNEELEIQNKLEEIQDKIQDIAIDIYKASQEAIDDLKDLRKEWAKFEAMIYDSSKGESFLSLDNPIRQLKEIENELSNIYTISGKEARDYYNDIIAQQEKLKKNATTEDEIRAYDQAIEYYSKIRDSIDNGETLNNGLMQLALNDVVELKKIWDEWDETSRNNPIFGDNKAALKEQLEDAQKRLMKFVEDYEELIEDFKDKSLDIADHTADQWDKQLDRFDRVIDQLDRYSDTYSLIYGDEAYEMQENVLHQQAQTLQQQLDTAKLAYDAANSYYLQAYEKFVDKETGLAKEGYEAYMYELEEARNDAEDKMRDIAAEAAKKWAEAFEAAVKNSTQVILQNTIGENNFDHLDRNWEWDKEYTNKYRDDVEKAYELDKLRNRYMDMLNNAQGASLQTQNKIRAQMQEQLDLLNNQKTVSEYDVKLANAKLEILQKQIALEDAQRNKNKMQLRRDTQGNYRYVYTADKNDVSQAQQELLDSEYDAYEMSKQQQMNNYDDMINAYKRYLSQREEILANNNLSEAEKIQQIQELWDRFQKYVKAAKEDFKDATAGTVDILQWLVVNGTDYTATAASDMLNQLLDEEGNIVEQSGILWMDLAYKWENEIIPKIEDAIIEADDHIVSKMQETHDALVGNDGSSGLLAEVSGGANNFGDQCEIAAQQTEMLANQSIALREALLGDNSAFAEAQDQLANYQRQLEDVANASAITAQTLRDTQEALDRANAENLNYRSQIDRLLSGEDIIVDHKIVNAAEYKRQQEEAKRAASGGGGGGGGRNHLADARAIWYNGAWGNGGDWYTPYSRLYGRDNANKVLWYFNHGYGYDFDFDTGGYTGKWDKSDGVAEHKHGKLAFLHQKELVLNESDTKNILDAVSIIRNMSSIAQDSLSSMGKTSLTNNINSTYNPLTEQRVDIQASFPNATDAEDIRQALIGLSDRAYQYAHKII